MVVEMAIRPVRIKANKILFAIIVALLSDAE
jgi:hypothetical protein